MRTLFVSLLLWAILSPGAWGQAAPPEPSPSPPAPEAPPQPSPSPSPEEAILEGDLRIRAEIWDWFAPVPPLEDDYTFGHGRLRARLGYRNPGSFEGLVELQGVQLVGLPDNAIGPAPIGQMGPGAILYNHAGQSDFSSLGVRQAYLKLGDPQSFQAQLGRMDFGNAAEVMPKEPSLAWLKRARLKDRLIGTFDFSPFARSFDGLRLDGDTGDLHLTGFVAMPTQGGFEPGFSTTIDNYLISDLSITLKQGGLLEDGEAQLFWVHSDDQRPVPQVDNRPLALRGQVRAEGGDQIDTLGGHFIHKLGENGDALVWYAHQTGSWGQQRHVADAFSAELGYKFKQTGWEPWVRGGFSYYSGDSNPLDNVHGTFIAPLPTIRVYALTPFYSESNLQDLFLQLMLKPGPQTAARLELHNLRLAQAADLWYVGAGATRRTTINGYAGRPSGGNTGLANLLDLGVEHQIDANHKLSAYFGHVFGGPVIQSSFPANPNGNFFFLEYNLKLP